MTEEKMITTQELAKHLGVHPRTLLYWLESGKITCPYYQLNGKNVYRFKLSEVEQFFKRIKNEEINHE